MGHGDDQVDKLFTTYEDIHITIGKTAKVIKDEFNPDIMIAIGGGGFFPARVLRTFLKSGETKRNIPIQAIGLSLYEELGDLDNPTAGLSHEEKIGKEVVRTQWLDFSTLGNRPLIGRRILIVDEVDDSRTTLSYAVTELQKDIEVQLAKLPEDKRSSYPKTELAVFVVHNKLKTKLGTLPDDVKYYAGDNVRDQWISYPWEASDIVLHNEYAAKQKAGL